MAEPLGPVVVVGHASRDLVDDDARGWRLGGSATYVSHAIARLGVPVRAVVGVDSDAAAAQELALLETDGVDLHRVPLESGPIFENVETPAGRRQRCLGVGRALHPFEVPESWRAAPAWAFVPVLGEIGGSAWAGTPRPDSVVALGWQGLLRAAEAGGPTVRLSPSEDPVLERADIVVVGIDDLVGPGPWETEEAADQLAPFLPRPGQQLALTAGARGGRLFLRVAAGWKSLRYEAAESRVVDWTGAGDVFLGAYLASAIDPFLAGDALSERLAFAATVAAMSIEGRGITAMPTRDEVRARLATIAG